MLSRFTPRAVQAVRAAPLKAARAAVVTSAVVRAVVRAPFASRTFTASSIRSAAIVPAVVGGNLASVPRNTSLVVTAAGPDRAGVVHDMTKLLTTAGANVEESRMSILGNDFALLVRVTVPEGLDQQKLQSLISADFPEYTIGVRSTQSSSQFTGPVRILTVQVEGPDQPGIVQTLTKIFVDLKGSVRDLDTDCSNAPFAGYKIFSLKCVVAFPIDSDFDSFEKSLTEFEDAYGFDVQVQEGMNEEMNEEMENEKGQEDEEEMEEEEEEDERPQRRSAPSSTGPARRAPSSATPPPRQAPAPRGPPQAPPRAAPTAPRGPTGPPRTAGPPPRQGPPRR